MNFKMYKGVIESLLFFWGDPLDISSLVEILNLSQSQVIDLLEEMADEYISNQRGLQLKKINKSYQLVTNPAFDNYISKLKHPVDELSLTNSMMETLSIIAYKQPVTRVEIDKIRGVNSSSCIANLLKRNLIKELGKLDQIGRPIIYGTTDEFLRVFGIENITMLPKPKGLDEKGITTNEVK